MMFLHVLAHVVAQFIFSYARCMISAHFIALVVVVIVVVIVVVVVVVIVVVVVVVSRRRRRRRHRRSQVFTDPDAQHD